MYNNTKKCSRIKFLVCLKIKFFHSMRNEKLFTELLFTDFFRMELDETCRVQKIAHLDICLRFTGIYLEQCDL